MKRLLLISLALAMGAVVFAVRHSALSRAQAERKNLETQVVQSKDVRVPNYGAAVDQTNTGVGSAGTNELSSEERSELLRLRGEMAVLLREITEESNRLANPNGIPSLSPGLRETNYPGSSN